MRLYHKINRNMLPYSKVLAIYAIMRGEESEMRLCLGQAQLQTPWSSLPAD